MLANRYLLKTQLYYFLPILIIGIIVFLGLYFSSLAYDSINDPTLSALHLGKFFFELPHIICQLLPFVFYMSLLMGYGSLYRQNEMLVLRLSGFSKGKCFFYTYINATVIFIILIIFEFFIVPYAKTIQAQDKWLDGHDIINLITAQRFVLTNTNITIYSQKSLTNLATLKDNFISQNVAKNNTHLSRVGFVDLIQASDKNIYLENGRFLEFNFKTGIIKQTNLKKLKFNTKLSSNKNELDVKYQDLFQLVSDNSNLSWNEIYWRFSKALMIFILSYIALHFSQIDYMKNRHSYSLIFSVLFYLIYMNLLQVNKKWLSHHMDISFISHCLVHIIMTLIAITCYQYFKKKR